MARKLNDKAIAYVKVQALTKDEHGNRISGRAIHRALIGGQVEELGGPIEVSQRRVQQLVQEFRREHDQAIERVDPASLPNATNTERALLIAEVRRRRKVAAAMPDTSTKAIDLMTKCARFLDAIDRNYNGTKQTKDPAKVQAGGQQPTKSTLDLLGESLVGPASEALATPPSNGDGSGATAEDGVTDPTFEEATDPIAA